ncbi:MAG: histidine--tRNA ligase [Rhizobiales bacterium]|nr:histidine--tRNA ligase [Hyphomicrobiales bacterium]MBI3674115.1 histidine--tRNA ligase [Hyphomicrobiales bacterium]
MTADKNSRPKARLAKGFRDVAPEEIRGLRRMLAKIEAVYEAYGFEPVEQPFVEYTDALGKFLPDQDRPNDGVFSFQDDDEQWLSLRYDLTAPLARYVAENQQKLATPYRSYRQGWVFRNEKPGPGRFRQFMQFDADTVGSASPAADAEVCMMAADTMEALGIERGKYVVKVSNRKILDGLLEAISIGQAIGQDRRLRVLRATDKLDRLGPQGVFSLLTEGRKDESGDFTEGARLSDAQADNVMRFLGFSRNVERGYIKDNLLHASANTNQGWLEWLENRVELGVTGKAGLDELKQIANLVGASGYGERVRIDPTVVRGLEYYTGPVFECELLMETKDEDGHTVRFGSVGGGGRYDDLVARFTGQPVPATGFSIGVSRLYSALKLVGKAEERATLAPVVVLVLDKGAQGDYWRMVSELRKAGIRAEMYVGTAGMKAQMKYADKRGAPLVVIQGGDEKAKGEVQIKDLRLGAELASGIASREEYASQRLAQVSVPEAELVAAVKKALARE